MMLPISDSVLLASTVQMREGDLAWLKGLLIDTYTLYQKVNTHELFE